MTNFYLMRNRKNTYQIIYNLKKDFSHSIGIWKLFFPVLFLLMVSCQSNASDTGNKLKSEMKKIEIGDTIPDIILKDQNGKIVNLKTEPKGKNVVLYFYPMDDTKGCTAQACSFRDQYEDFVDANAVVIGISGQSVESHKNFADKYNLPFTLLSDEDNKVRKMFGVPTNLFGLIPGRVTYVINREHKVVYIFNSQTKIKDHVENTLNILNRE